MNVVMLAPLSGGAAKFVEVQGTAEGQAFSREQLDVLLGLAERGLSNVFDQQRAVIAVPPASRA
jgi:ribonuclease PH